MKIFGRNKQTNEEATVPDTSDHRDQVEALPHWATEPSGPTETVERPAQAAAPAWPSSGEAPTTGQHARTGPDLLIEPVSSAPLSPSDTGNIPIVGAETAPPVQVCPHCGGRIMTEQELVLASVEALTPTLDTVVPNMYRRLFRLAPHLLDLFATTPGLVVWIDPDNIDTERVDGSFRDFSDPEKPEGVMRYWRVNPEAAQVGKVFGAIKAVVALYDPDDPEKMDQLVGALNGMGRSHTRFDPPATIDEYAAVVQCVLAELASQAGPLWTPRLEMAWRKRLEFSSGTMLAAQATARLTGPGRRRRTV